jgi:radical SAM superfamily enzyme YgiQ (UPF0313 family)
VKKIVLIKPKSDFVSKMPRIPLALLFMGSALKSNGIDVKLIDTNVEDNYNEVILKECENASLVGISCLTSEVKEGLEISKLIKDNYDVKIIWGGIHASLFPQMTCEDALVDYVCFGEGEPFMLEMAQGKPLESIKGLVYKENGVVKTNEPRPYINLNELPKLDYSLVDMSKYFEGGTWRKAVDVQTSRGCPNACLFCVHSALNDHKVRMMSSDMVVDECERLVKEYGANYITFVDDNFFLNRKRAREICEKLIERKLNIKWFAEVRADYFRDGFIDKEFLELAERSGLSNLTIGAESGIPKYLELIGKGITTENIIKSAEYLSKTNISTAYSFMIGLPDETIDDIMTNIYFIEKIRKIYPNAICGLGSLRAYPKSELTDRFIKQGFLKNPSNLREFTDHNFNKNYIDTPLRPIWHKNPDFVMAISRYTYNAYGVYLGEGLKKHLKYGSVLLLPERIFHKIAVWRIHHKFFRLPLDLYISEYLHQIVYPSKFVKRLIRWRK